MIIYSNGVNLSILYMHCNYTNSINVWNVFYVGKFCCFDNSNFNIAFLAVIRDIPLYPFSFVFNFVIKLKMPTRFVANFVNTQLKNKIVSLYATVIQDISVGSVSFRLWALTGLLCKFTPRVY